MRAAHTMRWVVLSLPVAGSWASPGATAVGESMMALVPPVDQCRVTVITSTFGKSMKPRWSVVTTTRRVA